MRTSLVVAALCLSALVTAGSGLALLDAVEVQLVFVQGSAEAALVFVDAIGTDAEAKAALAIHVVSSVASGVHDNGWSLIRMELDVLHGGYDQAGECLFGLDLEAQACTMDWLVAA